MTLTIPRLKCDRDEPCSNCVARNVSCQYAPWPRGRVAAAQRRDSRQPDLNDRVRHLEQLLGSIVSQLPAGQQQQQQSTSTASPSIKSPASTYVTTQASLHSNGDGCEVKPGRMMANPNETIYVSSSHWSAICHEVTFPSTRTKTTSDTETCRLSTSVSILMRLTSLLIWVSWTKLKVRCRCFWAPDE